MACARATEALVEVGTGPLRAVRMSIACSIVHSAGDSVGVVPLDIVATCQPPNIVQYLAYKIVGIDDVLVPGQCNKNRCYAGPNWHGLPDHRTPVFCCPLTPKAFCCSQICHPLLHWLISLDPIRRIVVSSGSVSSGN